MTFIRVEATLSVLLVVLISLTSSWDGYGGNNAWSGKRWIGGNEGWGGNNDWGNGWNSGNGWGSGNGWNSGNGWGSGNGWNSGNGWGSGKGWNSGNGWGSGKGWNSGNGWGSGKGWNSGNGWGNSNNLNLVCEVVNYKDQIALTASITSTGWWGNDDKLQLDVSVTTGPFFKEKAYQLVLTELSKNNQPARCRADQLGDIIADNSNQNGGWGRWRGRPRSNPSLVTLNIKSYDLLNKNVDQLPATNLADLAGRGMALCERLEENSNWDFRCKGFIPICCRLGYSNAHVRRLLRTSIDFHEHPVKD